MNMLPLVIGGIEIVVLMVAFFIAAAKDWGGSSARDNECVPKDTCFCETAGGWFNVKQRSNTWSNLVFVIVGLIILGVVTFSPSTSIQNPMNTTTFYSILFGAFAIFLGPGSMYFHASLKKWGGWLDNMSMNLFITFISVYTLTRLVIMDETVRILCFLGVFLIVNIGIGILSWKNDLAGTKLFVILTIFTLLVEFVIIFAPLSPFSTFIQLRIYRNWPWLAATLACFAVAHFFWSKSETGGTFCQEGYPFGWFSPTSWVQGHAIWHLMNSIAVFTIFLYLRSEVML